MSNIASVYVLGGVAWMVLSIALAIVQQLRGKKWDDLPAFVLAAIMWGWLIWALSGVVTVMAAFIAS
jgi:hypothetical protein